MQSSVVLRRLFLTFNKLTAVQIKYDLILDQYNRLYASAEKRVDLLSLLDPIAADVMKAQTLVTECQVCALIFHRSMFLCTHGWSLQWN